jgi:CRP-like cAMP-binding protein
MASIPPQKSKKPLTGDKSIPDHIIDGSIVIDSVEAFKSILKQFPDDAYLLKAYSDFLAKKNLFDLAAKSYSYAATLFVETGKILQAIVSKKLQWRIQSAKKEEVRQFLKLLKKETFNEIPLKVFLNRLTQEEILAVVNCFVRERLAAGTIVKKKGDYEDNLYFVVSGTLKDSLYPSLQEKVRVHRPSDIYLTENQFFGDVYPFDEDRKCESDIETTTQAELVKLSKSALTKLCNKFPNIELGILELCKIRNKSEKSGRFETLRKANRYHVPIDMNLEVYPKASANSTVIVDGYSSDLSVGGICVILDSNNSRIESLVEAFEKKANSKKIWIGLPAETMHIKVLGRIAWNHAVILGGKRTLVIGIQFEKMSPRLRGMLFMFASSLERQG